MKDNQWWKHMECKPRDSVGELDLIKQIEDLKAEIGDASGEPEGRKVLQINLGF